MAGHGDQDWKDEEKESFHDEVFGPVLGLSRRFWRSGNCGVWMALVKSSAAARKGNADNNSVKQMTRRAVIT
jgi:hypothetical protein